MNRNKKTISLILAIFLTFSLALSVSASSNTISKEVTYRDIKIILHGTELTPTDVNGNSTEPFIMDGTTYLPVRALAEALGLEVDWDDATSTVTLRKPDGASVLAAAVYPKMAPFPEESAYLRSDGRLDEQYWTAWSAWQTAVSAQRAASPGMIEGLDAFTGRSLRAFLGETTGENRVFAPLNVYLALAMLSELTDGQSRAQLLSLLGVDSVETLRQLANALWNANYRDDGLVSSILASSLWLNDQINFVPATMQTLAETYYASSYQGVMGSPAFNQALQNWINGQTGGLLEEQAAGLEMDARTLLALATTIYFKAPWTEHFYEGATKPGTFHMADGGERTADFMHQSDNRSYFWGEHFSAVSLAMENGGAMWFLLPDEGVMPEELLSDGDAIDFLLHQDRNGWTKQKRLQVNLSVPKFDVASDIDLIPVLQTLGIADVFDPTVSDFSPMTPDIDQICVSQARHAARVVIDEEGCIAAAYTVIMIRLTAMPPMEEEIDFTLDRPFLFCITGTDGLPLFVGTVNHL